MCVIAIEMVIALAAQCSSIVSASGTGGREF
jgi:hypothetical protein